MRPILSTPPSPQTNRHTPLRRLATWLIALPLILIGACSPEPETEGTQPLVVGMELAYPPFETRDTDGAPLGVSVDIANALGTALGRPVKIENMRFDGLIPALKTGKIDLILSSMTATEERRQSIDFSIPYANTGLCLLVGADSPIQTPEDLDQPGRTLAVKRGTTGHLFAERSLEHTKVLVLDKEDAAVLEVIQGKVDAFIYDQLSVYRHWRRHTDATRAILQPIQAEAWAIGITKGAEELKAQVDAFLTEFRLSGGFEKLIQEYFAEEAQQFQALGYPFLF